MKCAEIMQSLNNLCSIDAALSWDNVGLLIGSPEKEVQTIYIAIDATDEIINDAIDKGADLLITHHPMIFSPLKSVVDTDFVGRRVIKLVQNDISYVAMHTNFDVMAMGYEAADRLGLIDSEVLEISRSIDGENDGIGRFGKLKYGQSLKELSALVKQTFNLELVKVFGDLDSEVVDVAISPGSGKSVVDIAIEKGVDVLITGDIDHHTGIDANMQGLSIIDAGHYGIEKIFIQTIYEFFKRHYPDIKLCCESIKEPFNYV